MMATLLGQKDLVLVRGSYAVSCSLPFNLNHRQQPNDQKEVTMKTHTQIRIASLSMLAVLGLALAALPASAQVLYENGPINGNANAWSISPGNVVSDSINLNSSRSNVYDISFGVWESPGDTLASVDWSFTAQENGGTVFASGTASGAALTDTFLSVNQYGYNVDLITVSGLNVSLDAGTYWLNLENATRKDGKDWVMWDENSGVGCQSPGCPSQASDSAVGTIPSEAFTLYGASGGGSTPEPSSFALLGSGVLGLGGLLRRRFLG